VIEVGRDGKISKFEEKPEKPSSNLFCPPVYFLTSASMGLVPSYLQAQEERDAIGSFIKCLVNKSEVIAIEIDGSRLDLGTLEDYSIAKNMFSD
jgi:dTDP-glucose pyrophosphorylase